MRNVFLIFIITMLYGCPSYDPPQGVLTIHNYSDSAVYVYHTCRDSLPLTPKLYLFEKSNAEIIDEQGRKKDPIFSPYYRVNAYDYSEINVLGTANNPAICCKNDTLYLFFIKESIMRTTSWEDICKNQLYVQRVKLTEEQLKRNSWEFTYYPENNNN